MGVGLALSRGHDARRRGPPAEPAAARLQARHLRRRARDRGGLDRDHGQGGSARLEGRGGAAAGADRRRDRQRDLEGARRAGAADADDARARLGRGAGGDGRDGSFTSAADDRRGARGDRPRARVPSPAAPISWSARARARRRCPTRIVAIDRIEALGAISTTTAAALVLGTLVTHEAIVADATVREHGSPRSPTRRAIVGSARDARAGHDRRQRDERLAGDGHRRPVALPRRHRDPALGGGRADARARRAVDRPGHDVRDAERAARRRRRPGAGRRHRLGVRAPRVPPPDGDRGGRRDRGRHARRRRA